MTPPRVIVPFAPGRLQPLVEPVLRADGWRPELRPLNDAEAYSRLMRQIWAAGETTVIIEQDVLPWPGAIRELLECPCCWGSNSYLYQGGIGISHMLGCAKLSAELIRRLPGLWDSPVDWSLIDQHLFRAAQAVHLEPHLHRPPVLHINPRELGAGAARLEDG